MKHVVDRFVAGELPHWPSGWKDLLENEEYQDALCKRLEESNKEVTFLVEVGRNLLGINYGEVDVFQPIRHIDPVANGSTDSHNT